ncbi:hypothetical protein MASR2M18_12320 [Ignavibacteria bacterium]
MITFSVSSSLAADSLSAAAQRLQASTRYLASEELAGRSPGTDGNVKAARYIADAFAKSGLKPIGASYFQEFPIATAISMGEGNGVGFELVVEQPGVPRDQIKPVKFRWKPDADYIPLAYSDNSTATGKLVFAGYGISDAEYKYDDYSGVDVKGKVVIILRGTPDGDPQHGKFGRQAPMRSKITNAREKGAVAVIFINEPGDKGDSLLALKLEPGGKSGVIAVHAKRTPLARIFRKKPLRTIEEEIKKTGMPQSFEFADVTASVTVNLTVMEKPTANVIGVVPGNEPSLAGEYIVIGAHFDHLGMGDEGTLYSGSEPKIHYGADDNASGTAGMMELAARFAANPAPRSIIFMGYTAEERGLIGSKYYVDNPLAPLDNTVCMVNMDMIGRLKDDKLNVQGVGTAARWQPLVDSLGTAFGFALTTSADGYGPSDHSSFFSKNKPVLFFFTGLHPDYHRPTDTWDKINYEGEAKVVDMVEQTIRVIAREAKPDFIKTTSPKQSGSMSFSVSLGVIPDYSDHPKGLKITGVREGGTAEKAGLKADDIIVKLGATTIKNIYDYTAALGAFKAGDKTTVTVLRGPREDKEVVLNVTFEAKK